MRKAINCIKVAITITMLIQIIKTTRTNNQSEECSSSLDMSSMDINSNPIDKKDSITLESSGGFDSDEEFGKIRRYYNCKHVESLSLLAEEMKNPQENIIFIKNIPLASRDQKSTTIDTKIIKIAGIGIFTYRFPSTMFYVRTKESGYKKIFFIQNITGKKESIREEIKRAAQLANTKGTDLIPALTFLRKIANTILCDIYLSKLEKEPSSIELENSIASSILKETNLSLKKFQVVGLDREVLSILSLEMLHYDKKKHLIKLEEKIKTELIAFKCVPSEVFSTIKTTNEEIISLLKDDPVDKKEPNSIKTDEQSLSISIKIAEALLNCMLSPCLHGHSNKIKSLMDKKLASIQCILSSIRTNFTDNNYVYSEIHKIIDCIEKKLSTILFSIEKRHTIYNVYPFLEDIFKEKTKKVLHMIIYREISILKRKNETRIAEIIKEIDPVHMKQLTASTIECLSSIYGAFSEIVSTIKQLAKSPSENTFQISKEFLTSNTLKIVYSILKTVHHTKNLSRFMKISDEIWDSPVFLHCSFCVRCSGLETFITFKSTKDKMLYKKTVINKEEGLKAFYNAISLDEIESIEGPCEPISISTLMKTDIQSKLLDTKDRRNICYCSTLP